MTDYGWSIDYIEELTFEQIRLYHHLAWKRRQHEAQLTANKTAELIGRLFGG